MQASLLLLGALLSQADASVTAPTADGRPAVITSSPNAVTLSHCLISLNEEAKVPAREPGQLVKVMIKDGEQVTREQVLAQIDDTQKQMEYKAAQRKYEKAKVESENDINVRYSEAAADVADAQVLTGVEANQRVPGSVTQAQMREWKLSAKKFRLEIEQSRFKMRTDAMDAEVLKTQMEAAQEASNRHKIRAPLDGVVIELKYHEGEWVQPGDTLLRILRIDRLRIEGFLKAEEYGHAELKGRAVSVNVMLAHGRKETFQGKVVYVDPLVEAGGEFRVRVEVLNRKENDSWLLNPGTTAEMTIHFDREG